MTTRGDPDFDFDVALSFAGEDRELVNEVNNVLKEKGVRTFLDSDYRSEAWGEDLVEYFDGVYRKRSHFAMLFVSRHYAEKMWPKHERRSALARAIEERGAYILPVRIDDAQVDGLRPTIGYIDLRRIGIEALVRAFVEKLHGRIAYHAWPGDRTPRTILELDEVRSKQPPGWEYLYFAGVLHVEKEALESQFLDFELEYADRTGERVPDAEAPQYMSFASRDAVAIVNTLMRMFKPHVQEKAFGAPGMSGDAARIKRTAERWTSVYKNMMEWSAKIRGASHSSTFNTAFDLLARYMDNPVREYREFVDDLVVQFDQIPMAFSSNRPLKLDMSLQLTVAQATVDAFNAEIVRLEQEML